MKNIKFYLSLIALLIAVSIALASCNSLVESTPTEAPTSEDGTSPIIGPEGGVPTLEEPTEMPTEAPTSAPTSQPTSAPTQAPTENDTSVGTGVPDGPSEHPTEPATEPATEAPTEPKEYDYSISFYTSGNVGISDETAVTVSGKIYKIVKPGIYSISGKMADGQIRVEVQKTEKVTLLLNNFDGACSDSAVIYVVSADKVEIDLAKNSVNVVTDATKNKTYAFENPADDKPNACIYSSEDLEIKGGGELYVNGQYNNGIGTKNDLEIKNGKVYVSAVKNALKGNDSVTICGDAVVDIKHAKDGIKADTTAAEKPGKGYVKITDEAQVTVKCTDEAVQATQNITITTGAILNIIEAKNQYKCDGTTNIDAGCIVTK